MFAPTIDIDATATILMAGAIAIEHKTPLKVVSGMGWSQSSFQNIGATSLQCSGG